MAMMPVNFAIELLIMYYVNELEKENVLDRKFDVHIPS
jgi:hypothetical protein